MDQRTGVDVGRVSDGRASVVGTEDPEPDD